ncbi:MAG: monothiol glutaredoxin grx4 [Phylliscum demangeonii]|nr:MAG: monothiol glutaredoxin grx4 [Phylliscum demangeonii]
MSLTHDITNDADFHDQLRRAPDSLLLVVNFFAHWAAPCKQMHTILTELASSYSSESASSSSSSEPIAFLHVNAEDLVAVADSYGVESVPYLVLIRGGEVLETVSGSNQTQVRSAIEKYAGKAGAAGREQPKAAAAATTAQLPPAQTVEIKPHPGHAHNDGDDHGHGGSGGANGTNGTAIQIPSGDAPGPHDPSTAHEMKAGTTPETSAASAKEELHNRLSSLVKAAPVMLFMKGTPSVPQCGFSRQLVGLLRERGVRYGFFNILADEEVRQGLKEFADWPTFPQLWTGGELVGGLDIVKEEVEKDPNFLMEYAVKRQPGGPDSAPASALASTQAPTATS